MCSFAESAPQRLRNAKKLLEGAGDPAFLSTSPRTSSNLPSASSPAPSGLPVVSSLVPIPVSGTACLQGRRKTMEDRHVVLDDLAEKFPSVPKNPHSAFFAVYDGHGGTEAAELAEQHLVRLFVESSEFAARDFSKALARACTATDAIIIEAATKGGWKNGCTCAIVYLHGNILYAANVGDSECLLARRVNGRLEPVALSYKHVTKDESEKARIEKLGGLIFNGGRLYGNLAITRALGDMEYKRPISDQDYLIAEPYQRRVELTPEYEFLVVACDGLFEKVSHQDAVDLAQIARQAGKDPRETAEQLVREAYDRGSKDNITCIVTFLKWPQR